MREPDYLEKYKDLSDEGLVCLCRNGSQDAFTALSVRFIFVLKNKADELRDRGVEAEDLYQEGLIALNSAVMGYSESEGAAFRTYASACIRNRMISAVRKANSSGSLLSTTALPLSEQTEAPSAAITEPESALAAAEGLGEVMRCIEERLTPLEKNVLYVYLEDKSYDEIAAQLNISKKACDNAMQRVRRKLRSMN